MQHWCIVWYVGHGNSVWSMLHAGYLCKKSDTKGTPHAYSHFVFVLKICLKLEDYCPSHITPAPGQWNEIAWFWGFPAISHNCEKTRHHISCGHEASWNAWALAGQFLRVLGENTAVRLPGVAQRPWDAPPAPGYMGRRSTNVPLFIFSSSGHRVGAWRATGIFSYILSEVKSRKYLGNFMNSWTHRLIPEKL